MVFGWDNVPEALKLLYPLDTTDSTGVVRTVLTLTPTLRNSSPTPSTTASTRPSPTVGS